MKETNKSFGHKFIETQDHFFKSKWSIISFTTSVIIFAILQIILFTTDVINVSGQTEWAKWAYMILSPLGAALSLIGYVYTVRVDKKFFIPTMIGQIITTISSFLSGMTYTGFVMFIMISSGIWRMLLIKYKGPNYEINKKQFYSIAGTIAFVLTIAFSISAIYIPTTSWFWNSKPLWFRELDVFSCLIAMIGTMFLITKNKLAFYMFLLCNVLFVILFIQSLAWMNAIQILIYVVCNTFAAAAWTYRSKHPEEFK